MQKGNFCLLNFKKANFPEKKYNFKFFRQCLTSFQKQIKRNFENSAKIRKYNLKLYIKKK